MSFERTTTEAYLKALEEKDACLEMLTELPNFEDLDNFHAVLKGKGFLDFHSLFHEPIGFYFFKLFLISNYEGLKAVFIKDVEAYKKMRFESARRRLAHLLYERFVADETDITTKVLDIPKEMKFDSTFAILQKMDEKGSAGLYEDDPTAPEVTLSRLPVTSSNLLIGNTNAIGVYGQSIHTVKDILEAGQAPADLFDEVSEEVMNDLSLDVFPRFKTSPFYRKFIQSKFMETKEVFLKDFTVFRVLGRGGFGAVKACRKNNSGSLYAIKYIAKNLVKAKDALDHIMAERDVLSIIHSPFVAHLKYAFQDKDYLYIVMDLLLGGDLKFHLIQEGRFGLERARYYAAEVLLALEHLHALDIIYRDLKLENVILDDQGHARLVDLGLAVISKGNPIKGYAGTPGYCAPEMVANHSYGSSVDIFSFGVLLYRMLRGSKPFTGRSVDDLDHAVLKKEPNFNSSAFNEQSIDLLKGLLRKRPEQRLGCGSRALQEIKDHAFFDPIDWGLLESGYINPPFVPNREDVNAPPAEDIGDFDLQKWAHIRLGDHFKQTVKKFDFISSFAVQQEMVNVLEKAHANVKLEKFAERNLNEPADVKKNKKGCILS